MSSSATLNGLSSMNSRSSSLLDDSEESFVVLNSCVDEIAEQIASLPATNPEILPPTNAENVGWVSSTTMVTSRDSIVSGTSELSAEEIQQKMGNLLRENSELKETLKQNNLAIKQQYEALAKWQEDVVKVQESHKIKFEETKKLVLNLKTENAELKKIANSSNDSSTSSKEHLDLKSKISALEFELDTLRQTNTKYNIDQAKIIQELELKLSESEKTKFEESTKYKNQIDSLASQLNAVESEYNKIKNELVEVKQKLPTEIDIANIENMKEQLKELAQEILLKTAMLKEKTDLIETLHETISKLKIENESIPILRTQVDVYQSDFNQEREAREKLKNEKDKIAEDLHNLQRRNHKLLEQVEILQKEVERLQKDGFVHVPGSSSSRATPTRESPPLAAYTCPICGNNYRNLGSLEEHVERCLQNSSA